MQYTYNFTEEDGGVYFLGYDDASLPEYCGDAAAFLSLLQSYAEDRGLELRFQRVD